MVSRSALLALLAPAIASADPAPQLWAGGAIDMVPYENIPVGIDHYYGRAAYGLDGRIEYAPWQVVSIGFAPRAAFGIQPLSPLNYPHAGRELDLRVRITLGGAPAPGWHVALVGELGESFMQHLRPELLQGTSYAYGFELTRALSPSLRLTGELTYQHASFDVQDRGGTSRIQITELTLAVGVLFALR